MFRPAKPPTTLVTTLFLLTQGGLLLTAGRWSAAPHLPLPYLFALLCLIATAMTVRRWLAVETRSAGVLLLLAGQLGLLVLSGNGIRQVATDPEQWRLAQQEVLTATADEQADLVERIASLLVELGDVAREKVAEYDVVAAPFVLIPQLRALWDERFPQEKRFRLAMSLWYGGERIGWDDWTLPLPLETSETGEAGSWDVVQERREGWYWRRFQALAVAGPTPVFLEMQMRLAPATETDPGLVPAASGLELSRGDVTVYRVEVVQESGPPREQWRGDAEHGLQLTRDLELGATHKSEDRARLRLVLHSASLRVQQHRQASGQLMMSLLAWTVAVVGFGWTVRGAAGLLLGCWFARALLVGVDFFRWAQPALLGLQLPARPGGLSSLIDPAYFATPYAGGWFASAADALLTAALVAGSFWMVARAIFPRRSLTEPDGQQPTPEAGRLWTAIAFGLLAGCLLFCLRFVIHEIVVNANARLIGPSVPVRFLSFWALHLVLLLVTGSVTGLLAALATRWRFRHRRWLAVVLVLVGCLPTWFLMPDVSPLTAMTVAGVACLLWWLAPFLLSREISLRRLAVIAPVLLTVIWNYSVLAEAYGRVEQEWLLRKGDLIVLAQEDWIQFLMEDVLAEMSVSPPAVSSPDSYSWPANDMWQNRAAYDLWRQSAVHDLGLPCLVEILDADGYTESLFTAGFLGDFSYEVSLRSEWRASQAAGLTNQPTIWLQTESRRYLTGKERLLRGEVERSRTGGWIRLEMPIQSERITTILSQLVGAPSYAIRDGYRPRAEVDRPLLLLRGADSGWLDAGSGSFPDNISEPAVADLRSGRSDWGVVRVAGKVYRCLWRPLPVAMAEAEGEGFLLGLLIPSLSDLLLDLSRLLLLDLFLLVVLAGSLLGWRPWRKRRPGPYLGFQERFLTGYLILGLLLLSLAGMFIDRLNLQRLVGEARQQTRDGLTAGMAQLQGLLGEQARSLAESDYIADLLANRLAGQRPLGPFSARQGMVFTSGGQLLLDETLSDLDAVEAANLLATARRAPLLVMDDGGQLYLGTTVPIDLSAVLPDSLPGTVADSVATGRGEETESRVLASQDGFFFYRQRVDTDLLAGLADIIQGEVTLRIGGETVLSSHPERVFSGTTPLMVPPDMMRSLRRHPFNPYLYATPGTRLSFTGCMALPVLAFEATRPELQPRRTPAVLAVKFPARERDFGLQREQTVLYLAGLASLILITAALLALVMTWNIFGPVRVLVTATRRLAGGDFAAPLPEMGRDEIGTLARSFGTMRDELRQAQAAIEQRERFLTTVLNRISVGVAVFDVEGEVVVLNPAGKSILETFFSSSADGEESTAQKLLTAFRELLGPREEGDGELRSHNGRNTLRGRLAPLALPEGRRDTIIVFEDVTEFLNTKRLALNAELARQVAHEIKNPLTPIQLSVQLLQQAYDDRSDDLDRIVKETVRQVLEQVTLLRSIATEFSLLGRPGDLECMPLDLPTLVEKVLNSYQARIAGAETPPLIPVMEPPSDRADSAPVVGPMVHLETRTVPPVLAHTESLVKVLGNLMENSLDAKDASDRLVIQVAWQVAAESVTLRWEDNGPGIPSEVADRLFDPYFSTKSRGTGLGLAICRNLLDKMGGRINLRNRSDGQGAVAEVTLPRADDETSDTGADTVPSGNSG
ncbi:MAG: ATP-binding protein [bacterium]